MRLMVGKKCWFSRFYVTTLEEANKRYLKKKIILYHFINIDMNKNFSF